MQFSLISSPMVGALILLSCMAIASIADEDNHVVTAGGSEAPKPGVTALLGVTCDKVTVILEEQIKTRPVMQDLQIVMRWSYYRQDCWITQYPICSSKVKQQSPININTTTAIYRKFPPLILNNSNIAIDYGMMGNIYKAAQFRVIEDILPTIRGGPILNNVTLSLFAMFLYFNTDDNYKSPPCHGSAHAINGVKYPAELYVVWTQNVTSRMTDVMEDKVGETITTSFMIQIQEQDNPAWDAMLLPFANAEKCPIIPEDFAAFRFSSFLSLLPSTQFWLDHYYVYDGSMLSPPCNNETHIIFADPIYVSQSQLTILQSLKDENGLYIKNVRQLQPVRKSTKIYTSLPRYAIN